MAESKKKPAIRFSGFTEAWEQRKLGDIVEITMGQSPEGSTYSIYPSKYILVQGNADLKDGWVNPRIWTTQKTKTAESGDLIMSVRAPAGSMGKTGYDVVIGRGVAALKGNEFIYQLLVKMDTDGYWRKFSTGSTFESLNSITLFNAEILIPSENEQRLIGIILELTDRLITLHQRKYEKLINIKKSMLEKLFPKNGSNFPEIRFKGFANAWEQRKLGDIVEITMGQSPEGSTYSIYPSKYILVQGNADLKDGWVNPRIWTTQKTKTAESGDLIMSVRAPAGSMGKTGYDVVIGRGVAALKGNEFIYQLLVKMDTDGYWRKFSTGSTFESLNSITLFNAEILIPSENEQRLIGIILELTDRLITLHQRKLEMLKKIKKSCLEKMFV